MALVRDGRKGIVPTEQTIERKCVECEQPIAFGETGVYVQIVEDALPVGPMCVGCAIEKHGFSNDDQ